MTGIYFNFKKFSEGSVTLYYELYLDSLFFMNFVMDFYLLWLVNRACGHTATWLRLLLGAAYGAVIYCLIFLFAFIRIEVRMVAGFLAAFLGMAAITFKCRSISQFVKILSVLTGAAFFMGGMYLFLRDRFPLFKNMKKGVLCSVGIGGIVCLAGCRIMEMGKRKKEITCRVYLQKDDIKIEVEALIDTGNSLLEPISKKPVSILDQTAARQLFGGCLPEYYRVVPFTSIGKKNGLLKGFEVPKMWIEYQDRKMEYENVYVACSEDYVPHEGFRMILNPGLMKNLED